MEPADPSTQRSPTSRSQEDAALVRRIGQGDPRAVAELFDRYGGVLLALAQRILGDPADAEEVVQEAFLQAWGQAGRYDPSRSSVSTWLVLIARSRAIDRLRSRRVAARTVGGSQESAPEPHTSPGAVEDVFMRERRRRLQEELAGLPPEQRQVLDLAFHQGMTQREIAEATRIPLGTVKTRTLLALRKLRKSLGAELEELL